MTGLEILALAGIITSLAGTGAGLAQSSSASKKAEKFQTEQSDKSYDEMLKQKALQEQQARRAALASVVKGITPEKAESYIPPKPDVAPAAPSMAIPGALAGMGNAATQYATWRMSQPTITPATGSSVAVPTPTVRIPI